MQIDKMKSEIVKTKEKINYEAIFLRIFDFFVVPLRNFLSFFTPVFPFSLISERFLFHYKNKPICDVLDAMVKIMWKTGLHFSQEMGDVDENFVYLEGKFERLWAGAGVPTFLKYLKEKFGEDFVHISKLGRREYRILVSRTILT